MADTTQVDVVITDVVLNEIAKGRKIQAIKLLRQERGIGLKEAKDLIDQYIESNTQAKEAYEANRATGISQEALFQIVIISIVLVVAYSLFWQ